MGCAGTSARACGPCSSRKRKGSSDTCPRQVISRASKSQGMICASDVRSWALDDQVMGARSSGSRCQANMVHVRQSRPDYGLGFQVNVLKRFCGVPSSLGKGPGGGGGIANKVQWNVRLPRSCVRLANEVSHGEKTLYSWTDPESYITEYTLVNQCLQGECAPQQAPFGNFPASFLGCIFCRRGRGQAIPRGERVSFPWTSNRDWATFKHSSGVPRSQETVSP